VSTARHGIRCIVTAKTSLFALVFVLVLAAFADAGTLRGRLVHRSREGDYPAKGIPVTVFRSDTGKSLPAYSGTDGMYYLYNLPTGCYTLQVWLYPNSSPLTFTITVDDESFTDIAPIIVP